MLCYHTYADILLTMIKWFPDNGTDAVFVIKILTLHIHGVPLRRRALVDDVLRVLGEDLALDNVARLRPLVAIPDGTIPTATNASTGVRSVAAHYVIVKVREVVDAFLGSVVWDGTVTANAAHHALGLYTEID
jgi:hypothetical protein